MRLPAIESRPGLPGEKTSSAPARCSPAGGMSRRFRWRRAAQGRHGFESPHQEAKQPQLAAAPFGIGAFLTTQLPSRLQCAGHGKTLSFECDILISHVAQLYLDGSSKLRAETIKVIRA